MTMNQGSIATEQLHISVQSLVTSFQVNAEPTMRSVTQLEQSCRDPHPPLAGVPSMVGDRAAACKRLLAADSTYRL